MKYKRGGGLSMANNDGESRKSEIFVGVCGFTVNSSTNI
mgnify:CR=1 FL=1